MDVRTVGRRLNADSELDVRVQGQERGVSGYAAVMPSLTGIHKFDRVSRKEADEGKTQCQVCGERPAHGHEADAWAYLLAAEEETERIRTQQALMRSVAKGYSV